MENCPFRSHPRTPALASRIQDVLCDIPGLVEDSQTFRTLSANAGSEATTKHAWALHERVSATINQLCDLRWQWEDEFSHTCREVVARKGTTFCIDSTGEPLFPTVLFFDGLERVMEIANFDAIFIILYNIIYLVKGERGFTYTNRIIPSLLAPRNPSSTASPLLLPGQGDQESMAREICRLVDYCLQSKQDSLGAFTLL